MWSNTDKDKVERYENTHKELERCDQIQIKVN